MRILVACEFSGIVRDAFLCEGHDAWSCDLVPSERPGPHLQCNVREVLHQNWDLMIAHPPCQYLAVSGARWFAQRHQEQQQALDFVQCLLEAPIPRICIENPVSIIASRIRKPDQTIQPWLFGHPDAKRTCFWLKNLPLLRPTTILEPREFICPACHAIFEAAYGMYGCACLTNRVAKPLWKNMTPSRQNNQSPSSERQKNRSRTYPGIAKAIATQWGRLEGTCLNRAG